MPQHLSRRAFLGTAIGVGILVGPMTAQARADTRTVYRLNPNWGAGDPTCVANGGSRTCGGCHACVKHAANKRFATRAAAEAGRAHPGCKCGVEVACAVDTATYAQLFATSASVDLRTPGVSEQLVCAPANPTVDPPGTPGGSNGGDVTSGGSTIGAPASSALAATGVPSTAAASTSPFAYTGAPLAKLALTGAAGVAIGAVLLRTRRRPAPAPAPIESDAPE